MIKKIAHVGIATRSIAVMSEFYKGLGLEIDAIETKKEHKVKAAIMRAGESAIELLEGTSDDSPVSRFIDKHGEGIHHISLEVDDLQGMLVKLKERGVKLIDERPRRGADGKIVAFVHPHSTGGVLVELCQEAEGA